MRHKENTNSHRYNVLANTVRQLVINKGRVSEDTLVSFIAGGYDQAQFLELVMGICVKTFTNYVSNALSVELDDAFKSYAWLRPSEKKQM